MDGLHAAPSRLPKAPPCGLPRHPTMKKGVRALTTRTTRQAARRSSSADQRPSPPASEILAQELSPPFRPPSWRRVRENRKRQGRSTRPSTTRAAGAALAVAAGRWATTPPAQASEASEITDHGAPAPSQPKSASILSQICSTPESEPSARTHSVAPPRARHRSPCTNNTCAPRQMSSALPPLPHPHSHIAPSSHSTPRPASPPNARRIAAGTPPKQTRVGSIGSDSIPLRHLHRSASGFTSVGSGFRTGWDSRHPC